MANQHREKYDSVDFVANADMKNESPTALAETTHGYTAFSLVR